MEIIARRGGRRGVNIWPGFVDALATLLLVFIFVLLVFTIAQNFLSSALSGKDAALVRLQSQIDELAELLALERDANADLRLNLQQVSTELQSSLRERDTLAATATGLSDERASLMAQLAALTEERNALVAELDESEEQFAGLRQQLAALTKDRDALSIKLGEAEQDRTALSQQLAALLAERDRLAQDVDRIDAARSELSSERDTLTDSLAQVNATLSQVSGELEDAYKVIEADKEKIEAQLAELAVLQQLREQNAEELRKAYETIDADKEKIEARLAEIAALKQLRDQLNADLEDAYKTTDVDKATIEAQLREIAILKSLRDQMTERLAREGTMVDLLRDQVSRTKNQLSAEQELSREARAQVALLNRQLAALREQLAQISAALELSEAKSDEQETRIADLGRRLNAALAGKVQELARYRSEFFGRLREVLGNRKDIRIVGDRFVFQSEVLFDSGSAALELEGQQQMRQLAETLLEISEDIPADIDWVLRVDGHTDKRPIRTAVFPSNWELSTARALSVVRYLIDAGIPPDRLAATGFGEFRPLVQGDSAAAYSRNRRIEIKLDQQ